MTYSAPPLNVKVDGLPGDDKHNQSFEQACGQKCHTMAWAGPTSLCLYTHPTPWETASWTKHHFQK